MKTLFACAALSLLAACAVPGELRVPPSAPTIAGATMPALPPYRAPDAQSVSPHAAPRSDPSATP